MACHFALDQFGRQFRESIELTVCPAEFNRNVLAVNVARFVQRPAEHRHQVEIRCERATTQETDHGRRRSAGKETLIGWLGFALLAAGLLTTAGCGPEEAASNAVPSGRRRSAR